MGQLETEIAEKYGGKIVVEKHMLTSDQFYGADKNKPFKIELNGVVLYDRLKPDGSNKPPEDDKYPSEDATAEFGEKGGRARTWGPIIVKEGNSWWGGKTQGKLEELHKAIQAQLK